MAAPKGSHSSPSTGVDPPVTAQSPITKIYNPAVVGTPHAVIFNNGSSFAYIGGSSVTPSSGFPLPPGAQITLPNANFSIWGCGGGVVTGTPSTSISVAGTAGGTALTFAGSVASFGTGSTVALGAGSAQEFITFATITSGTVITLSAPLLYDHNASATVTTITAQSGTNLNVNVGTT
jgi:hypothetical protein